MQGFKSLTQKRENIFFIALTQKRKQSIGLLFSFLKRCVPTNNITLYKLSKSWYNITESEVLLW